MQRSTAQDLQVLSGMFVNNQRWLRLRLRPTCKQSTSVSSRKPDSPRHMTDFGLSSSALLEKVATSPDLILAMRVMTPPLFHESPSPGMGEAAAIQTLRCSVKARALSCSLRRDLARSPESEIASASCVEDIPRDFLGHPAITDKPSSNHV